MSILSIKNQISKKLLYLLNKFPFLKACLIIGAGALIFLLGTEVGNMLRNL